MTPGTAGKVGPLVMRHSNLPLPTPAMVREGESREQGSPGGVGKRDWHPPGAGQRAKKVWRATPRYGSPTPCVSTPALVTLVGRAYP